jgi:hypothetical protein
MWMVVSCSSAGLTAGPCRSLAPQTRSIPDFVRMDLQTVRLAIACGDQNDRALHPSQVAAAIPSTSTLKRRTRFLERTMARAITQNVREEGNEQAWRERRTDWSVPVLAKGGTPETEGRMGWLISFARRTRTPDQFVCLERRCSSKRAVGDQSSPAPKRGERAWKDYRMMVLAWDTTRLGARRVGG